MRNLKKILSLALALVMVMSLLTVAGAKDFNDAADIEHTEAVEVMSALGVISGMGNNTFDPKGNVTRAQMAKMITYICLGNVEPTAFLGTTTNLTDINGHWAEAYIKYCYSQGIIAGRGNGIFAPDANVTATEAARMLLVAIGYNADVQVYTGSQWSINVTRDAQISKLYDDVSVTSTEVLNRDKAAQMMYNALNAKTIVKSSQVDRVTGDITDIYTDNGPTLLSKSYDAQIWVGEFTGNHDFNGSGAVAGEIVVNGRIEGATDASGNLVGKRNANFPSDFDIKYIGEEVKVIFKDGTSGAKNRPDKQDTIYGVYVTGGTTVYNITRADLQEASSSDVAKGKIKFGGTVYDVDTGTNNAVPAGQVDVYLNYAGSATTYTAAQINASNHGAPSTSGLRGQSVDSIKFVANDDGKIFAAYVTEYKIARVSGVTSSKITIEGVGSIDIEGNDIYDGPAVDDVVVYTRYYSSTNRDDATFSVQLAETIEGELTGFKNTDNVVVDGNTYKLNNKTLVDVSDDEITTVASGDIGTNVRLYMVNGMVGGIQKTEEKGGKYALITEYGQTGSIGGSVSAREAEILLTDGTKQVVKIHKDSTKNGSAALATSDLSTGSLVEYTSISDGSIKIYKVAGAASQSGDAQITGNASGKVWNKDTKALTYTGNTTAVAASNATLFVLVDKDADNNIDTNENTYAYNLRDMGNIANTASGVKVAYFLNDDGLIAAAYAVLTSRPGSGTANTLYGMVTSYDGTRTDSDDTVYQLFSVAVGRDSDVEVRIEAATKGAASIDKGDLVTFDETNTGYYDPADFTKLVTADDTANSGEDWTLAAVDNYSDSNNLLTYFTATQQASANSAFTGVGPTQSITVKSDVKIVYVDGKNIKGDDAGSIKFNNTLGYANLVFHTNDDGIVDVMVFESTGDGNLAKTGDDKEISTTNFGSGYVAPLTPTADVTLALTTPSVGGGNSITTTGSGTPKTVAVNVVNTTASVVITGTKTADQAVAIGGIDAAKVTLTPDNATAPVWTVNTDAVKTTGGDVTFTLTVSEDGKSSVVYNVTVTVADPAGPIVVTDLADLKAKLAASENATATFSVPDTVTSVDADLAIKAGQTVDFAADTVTFAVAQNIAGTVTAKALATTSNANITVAATGSLTTTGTVNVGTGKIAASGNITLGGDVTGSVDVLAAANASVQDVTVTLTVNTTGTVTMNKNLTGALTVTKGTVTGSGAARAITYYDVTGAVSVAAGTVTIKDAKSTAAVTGTGSLTAQAVTTSLTMSGAGTASVKNVKSGDLTAITNFAGATVTIADPITAADADLTLSAGTWNFTGMFTTSATDTVTIAASTTVNFDGGVTFSAGDKLKAADAVTAKMVIGNVTSTTHASETLICNAQGAITNTDIKGKTFLGTAKTDNKWLEQAATPGV